MKPIIHIIGGTGQMGNWLKIFLESQGYCPTVSGRENDSADQMKKADIVFISVPISVAPKVIKKTAKLLKANSLIVDLSSAKIKTAKVLKKINQPSLSIHLLYGPTISSLQNQKIIFCHVKDNHLVNFIENIFKNEGAQIIEMTPREHDFQMAHIQALTHFTNLSLAKILKANKIDLSGKVSTPLFLTQVSALNRTVSQNPELLSEIQLNNPLFSQIVKRYIDYQGRILGLIKNDDKKSLEEEYISVHQSIEPKPSKKSINESSKAKPKIKLSQKNLEIAYLGPEGTFSHQACLDMSTGKQKLIPCKTIYEIFEKIAQKYANFGIVPAENSIEGSIRETLDYLVNFDLKVNSSMDLPIHQNLLSKEKSIKNINKIISHPQAIAQCRNWILNNLPKATIEHSKSTVSDINKNVKNVGIIGSSVAAKTYQLNILSKNIEDSTQNITKFYIISKKLNAFKTKPKRTLLYLSIFNRVGILKDILEVFASFEINLNKIESRPSKEKVWDYYFFIEIEAAFDNPKVIESLNIIKQYCPVVKIIGGM